MSAPDSIPIISAALPGDADTLRDIATEAGIDAWSSGDYRAEILREDSFVLAARVGPTEIAGFLLARTIPGQNAHPDADIYNIAVTESRRQFGVGGELLKTLISMAREQYVENIWLEVRASNNGAINFYSKYGFQAELTRRNFYSNPTEDAVIMRLKMTNEPESRDISNA
jgi:[ribosomal protein S18]-alanine N-acetyltransferase